MELRLHTTEESKKSSFGTFNSSVLDEPTCLVPESEADGLVIGTTTSRDNDTCQDETDDGNYLPDCQNV